MGEKNLFLRGPYDFARKLIVRFRWASASASVATKPFVTLTDAYIVM